jgi:predicted glycogen debranching enzyme
MPIERGENMPGGKNQVISDREWVLADGLGGYALGFGNMMNKRKYDGLLVASDDSLRRTHILSSFEERVEIDASYFFLDSSHYKNCIYPDGYTHIVRSWLRPYPCALYSTAPADANILIFKEIFMPKGRSAVVVKYTNMSKKRMHMTLRPKFTLRGHHDLNQTGVWDRVWLEREISDKALRVTRRDNGISAYLYIEDGQVIDAQNVIYRSVYYPNEASRGYDSIEDLNAPVRLEVDFSPGASRFVIVSAEHINDAAALAREAERRYKSYSLPKLHPERADMDVIFTHAEDSVFEFERDDYRRILELASDEFIVESGDVVAGYPWFGAWGRDTMISLGSFAVLKGGKEMAVRILKRYGALLKRGLLPNTCGEGGAGLNYDSVDAPLWFAVRAYQLAPGDSELLDRVSHVVLNYLGVEDHQFFIDADGLLSVRSGAHAITWMDANVYGNPVTPRLGKPVEINALWYNALCAVVDMARMTGRKSLVSGSYSSTVDEIAALAGRVRASMQKFVGDDYLADRIEDGNPVFEIRPNAVIALALPFDFAERRVMRKVWARAKDELLTQFGLRTLNPGHPAFKQRYIGNQKQRDLAYHQGTAWTFLLRDFAILTAKALEGERPKEEVDKEISSYVWAFRDAFMKDEMASAAEVWDGIDPYFPKGCPAQAWSAFALLSIEEMLGGEEV